MKSPGAVQNYTFMGSTNNGEYTFDVSNGDNGWKLNEHGSCSQFKWLKVTAEKIEIRAVKTENSAAIETTISSDDRFALPKNIELRNLENGAGDTIRIYPGNDKCDCLKG